jgi:hypothetical protein
MKKIIPGMLLTAIALMTQGQSIVSQDKQWENFISYYSPSPYPEVGFEHIRFTNDVAIGNTVYKQVERALDVGQVEWYPYGYARENAARQVFYRISQQDPEYLIYDMELHKYDSVFAYSLETSYESLSIFGMMLYVTSVDSMPVGQTWHKRINLSLSLQDSMNISNQWVDSLGGLAGILHNTFPLVGGDSYSLQCYFENGNLQYHDPASLDCAFYTGIYDERSPAMDMILYPDPVRDILSIDLGRIRPKNSEIGIFDMTGKKRAAIMPVGTTITVDISGLHSGVYVVRFTGDHETVQGKIIKE